jgi:glycosyltransferase involved in cell wall biosynthesis
VTRLSFILPTFGSLRYARLCLESLLKTTSEVRISIVIVDDCTPVGQWNTDWFTDKPDADILWHRFENNGGLTRSWNTGFLIALEHQQPDYIVAGNSDVIVPSNWHHGLINVIESGAMFAGPLTNAPGWTQGNRQAISMYSPASAITSHPSSVENAGQAVRNKYGNRFVKSPINGFFMFGATNSWLEIAHDTIHVFPPVITHMPSGRKNPKPLMLAQEDLLNAEVNKRGRYTAAALGSFVYHFRGVSRGGKNLCPGWSRLPAEKT